MYEFIHQKVSIPPILYEWFAIHTLTKKGYEFTQKKYESAQKMYDSIPMFFPDGATSLI